MQVLNKMCKSLEIDQKIVKTGNHSIVYQTECVGFPGGLRGMNPPANAGNTGSNSDPGRFHVTEQLSPSTVTIESVPRAQEPQLLSLCVLKTVLHKEATTMRTPHTATGE